MTTIAAIEGPDWVMIGADSQSSSEDGFSINIPNGKVFKNNNLVFAMAGSVRGINILEHDFVGKTLLVRHLSYNIYHCLIF